MEGGYTVLQGLFLYRLVRMEGKELLLVTFIPQLARIKYTSHTHLKMFQEIFALMCIYINVIGETTLERFMGNR